MMTAGIVQGKVITATGLLQLFQSSVDKTKRAWGALPALVFCTGMIQSLINRMEKEGVTNIDPLEAKEVAESLRHLSDSIRRINARADMIGATRHLPYRMCMPALVKQGHILRRLSREVADYEQAWKQTVNAAALENMARSRDTSLSINLDTIDWSAEDLAFDTPEDEVRAQTGHVAVSPHSRAL